RPRRPLCRGARGRVRPRAATPARTSGDVALAGRYADRACRRRGGGVRPGGRHAHPIVCLTSLAIPKFALRVEFVVPNQSMMAQMAKPPNVISLRIPRMILPM